MADHDDARLDRSAEAAAPLTAADLSVGRDLADGAAFAADRLAGEIAAEVIELAQEFATIGVERREGGLVRLRTVTETEDSVLPAQMRREAVEVTRHKVEREVDAAPEPRVEGDLTIIPVVEERAVVVRRLFVTEEIHIRRHASVEDVELPVTLRRQRAVVERLDENGATMPAQADIGTERDQ